MVQNTEMLQAQGWRARAKAFIKMKIINGKPADTIVKCQLYLVCGLIIPIE